MAIVLEAFPKVSRELVVKSGYISTKYSFSYHDNDVLRNLTATPTDSSNSKAAILQIEDGKWHPEENGIIIDCKCAISTPAFLFGPKGLAAQNGGIIGVAIMWMAPDASVRGVERIGSLTKRNSGPCEITGRIKFPSKLLRGTLVLQTILYLKHKGSISEDETHLAQFSGTVLGILDETKVIIDGNGSIFPIHMVKNPIQPLWYVNCSWEDPTRDLFTDDNFCICFNTAYKDFDALRINEGIKGSPLLFEIICSALQILMTKVLNDPSARDATLRGDSELRPGSISSVVNYLIHLHNWTYDPENPDVLAMDIRKSMMKMML